MDILTQHQDKIKGVLSTFDRMIFKGHMGFLYNPRVFSYLLNSQNILIKDFPAYAERCTLIVKNHAQELAQRSGRPYIYLDSSKISKEQSVLKILEKNPIDEGLICVLACVELCRTFTTSKNQETGKLTIITQSRKCLYFYFYFMDKELGFMHVRLQTWFPFEEI